MNITSEMLRSRRLAAGVAQNVLAAALGIPARRLSDLERGHRRVPVDLAKAALRIIDEAPARMPGGAPASHRDGLHAHPLVSVRERMGLTQAGLARLLGGTDAGKVSRWERWVADPDMPTQYALAARVGVSKQTVATYPWPAWLPGTPGADVASAWNTSSTMAVLDATVGARGARMDRRAFLTLSTAAISGVAARWSALAALCPVEAYVGGSAEDLVATFESRLPWLRAQADEFGGGAALELVDAELGTAAVMMRQPLGRASARRLASVAAELARLAGWACVDSGRRSGAERYFATGLRAAYDATDNVTGANIIKSWALLLLECGRPHDARTLLDAAVRATASSPPRVQAMLRVRQARVEASAGNSAACETLLAHAAQLLERATDRTDRLAPGPSAVVYFQPAELAAQTAACHQLLNRHAQAQTLLEGNLDALAPRPVDRTTYQIWLGEASLAQGDVDRACSVLADALPDVAAGSSARNRARFAAARQQLRPYVGHLAVKDLDERSRALIT